MAFVKTKLGQQHRIAGELIEIVEQFDGTIIHHKEYVEIALGMREQDTVFVGGAKVVAAWLEGVPKQTVALGAPIEGSGRGHTAVYPVVGVFDGNGLPFVRETAVLHTATIEIFVGATGQRELGLAFVNSHRRTLFKYCLARLVVSYRHERVLTIERQGDAGRFDVKHVLLLAHLHTTCGTAWIVYQNLCLRRGLRVAQDAALVVAEHAKNVGAIKIERHHFAVGINHFDCGGVDEADILDEVSFGHGNCRCDGRRPLCGIGRHIAPQQGQ